MRYVLSNFKELLLSETYNVLNNWFISKFKYKNNFNALALGEGPQLLQPLGIMLFGGLTAGTLLTLNL